MKASFTTLLSALFLATTFVAAAPVPQYSGPIPPPPSGGYVPNPYSHDGGPPGFPPHSGGYVYGYPYSQYGGPSGLTTGSKNWANPNEVAPGKEGIFAKILKGALRSLPEVSPGESQTSEAGPDSDGGVSVN